MVNSVLRTIYFKNVDVWDCKRLANNKTFSSRFKLIPFSDVLKDIEMEWESIIDDKTYSILGVHAYGDGVYVYKKALGKELTMKKYQKTVANTLFWCKVRTVHGQFGIITDDLLNTYASSNMQYMKIDTTKIIPDYLQLLFQKNPLTDYMDTLSIGADGRHFNKSVLLNVKIPLPSIIKQIMIVQKYQVTIAKAEELEEQAEKIFNEIHGYFDTTLEISDLKPEIQTGLNFINYKNIDLWGPDKNLCRKTVRNKKYKTVLLEALCSVGSGGTPSRNHSEYYKNGNIPWVKTTEVTDEIITDTEEHITQQGLDNSSAKIYEPNSLIIAMYGQ